MKCPDSVLGLAGAWAMRPWVGGSAGACEHPADDNADDLDFVGPCVEPDGPVFAASALGAELDRHRVDAVDAPEYDVVRDACGDARELERAVRRALRAKDRAALAEIYRKLCRSELPISPSVARILRLIDRVGTAQAPSSVAPEAPGLPS